MIVARFAQVGSLVPQIESMFPWLAWTAVVAFATTIILTRPLISWLGRNQIGKAIRVDGPAHQRKSGTPTMGGLSMLVAVVATVTALFVTAPIDASHRGRLIAIGFATVAFAGLGAIDDLAGLARKEKVRDLGIGLTARHMIAAQTVVAVIISILSWEGVHTRWTAALSETASYLRDPLAAVWAEGGMLGLGLWTTVSVLIVVGTVNGVNLSDGLDGLAAGLLVTAFAALAMITLFGPIDPWIGQVCAAAAGACAGFLVFNRHPARVFMGNVGSMGLGGALGTAALVTGTWALLPIIGAVFVAEVLSDIIQIGYFKLSGGKRIFRMAPLHHHFEMGGMPETTVVRRFWLAGALAGAAGVAAAIAMIA